MPQKCFLLKACQVFKGIYKTVLYNILSIFLIAQHAHANIVHRISIERIKLVLRAWVSGLALFYKITVRKTDIGFQGLQDGFNLLNYFYYYKDNTNVR